MLLEAKATKNEARLLLETLRDQVEVVPARETAEKNIQQLNALLEALSDIQMEEQMLPVTADLPPQPEGFEGCSPRQAVIQAQKHRDEIKSLGRRRNLMVDITLPLGIFLLLFAIFLVNFQYTLMGTICGGMGILYLIVAMLGIHSSRKRYRNFLSRLSDLTFLYNCNDPEQWVETAQRYAQDWEAYANSDDGTAEHRAHLLKQKELLVSRSMMLTRGKGMENALDYWNDIAALWDEYAEALCNYRQANKQYQTLVSMNADAPPPSEEDTLSYTEEETDRLLAEASQELRQLLSKLGQYRGYADSLGSREALEAENTALEQRLLELEKTYAALDIALKSLEQASAELQRRFAPRISRSAQEILSQLTNGRYTRMTMSQDFSLLIGAQNEDTLRSRHWRSEGTVDQLYLALRLAVARELLPDAPLVLDDAMVRFDNDRLQAALKILQVEAQSRQVIIFTCHGRERELFENL